MKQPKAFAFSTRLVIFGLLACSSTPLVKGQTTTWTGGGSDNNWSTTANWSSGVPGNVTPGTANVSIAGTTRLTPNIDTNWSINRLTFTGTNGATGSFNVGGSTLTLSSVSSSSNGTNNALANISDVLQTVSSSIILNGTEQNLYFNAVNGDLTVGGNISLGTNRLILTSTGGKTITLSGNIGGAGNSNGAIATFNNNFSGTLVLSGVNNFTGSVTMNTGHLVVGGNAPSGSAGALGNATSAVILGSTSGTLATSLTTNGAYTVGRAITIQRGNTVTATVGSTITSGTSTFTGDISLGTSGTGHSLHLTSAAGGTVNITSNLVGSGTDDLDTLTKVGAGTVILAGSANTYTGTTQVNEGTLLVNGAYSVSGLGISVAADATLGGSGTINRNVTIAADGTLLGGTGAAASGLLTISGNVSLTNDSVISLVLGAAGAHSSIDFDGSVTFDSDQAFSFISLGATVGFYDNILTGLSGDPVTSGWTITNAGWVGTFTYENGNVDLNLSAVPEPSSIALLGLGLGAILWRIRRNTI